MNTVENSIRQTIDILAAKIPSFDSAASQISGVVARHAPALAAYALEQLRQRPDFTACPETAHLEQLAGEHTQMAVESTPHMADRNVPYAHLDDDDILIMDRTLACMLGLNNSIVLRQVRYWLKLNQDAKTEDRHFHDGCWWTFNTYEQWQEDNFTFWSVDTVRRAFVELEDLGLLVSSSKHNKRKGDQTKWYTINYGAYEAFLRLWNEYGCPRAGKTRAKGAPDLYAAFLDAWNTQKEKYTNLASCQTAQNGKLPKATMQVAKTVTRDYTETTPSIGIPIDIDALKDVDAGASVADATLSSFSSKDGHTTIEESPSSPSIQDSPCRGDPDKSTDSSSSHNTRRRAARDGGIGEAVSP